MVTYILIPAHNEESAIGHVIDSLKSNGWTNILVVNDASTDNTVEIATRYGAAVIDSLGQRGQGRGLQTGFEYFCSHTKPDVVVTFDADGQHRASDIEALVEPILEGRADITLGSRFLAGTSHTVPLLRMLVLKSAIIFTRILTGMPVTDTHCGLRALTYKAYSSIHFRHAGMAHASEFFDIIKAKQLRWEEVPVSVDYTKHTLSKGQKAYRAFPIAWQYILGRMRTYKE